MPMRMLALAQLKGLFRIFVSLARMKKEAHILGASTTWAIEQRQSPALPERAGCSTEGA